MLTCFIVFDTAMLSRLIVRPLLSCLPCPCLISVHQQDYSSSVSQTHPLSSPLHTDCHSHTHPLSPHLSLWLSRCTFLFIYSSFQPLNYILPVSCFPQQLLFEIRYPCLPLPVISSLSIRSVLLLQYLFFLLCLATVFHYADCFIMFMLIRAVVFRNYVLMLPTSWCYFCGQLVFTASSNGLLLFLETQA